ncbi:MAG TPA: FAD-dependent oxidoreductase [Bellilinea sp.]|nr:FAD-dependent oxidoreductase [Bellilinea sp.]
MKNHPYLIIGGGMTAASALHGIREVDNQADIAVISSEEHYPYNRPPLSKQLWTGKMSQDEIWRELPEDVTFYLNRTVVELDLNRREARDSEGTVYGFQKLLLATGGKPRRLPFGGDSIIYFRSLNSYRRLDKLAEEHDHFAVIGGGFIGAEIAAALAIRGKHVVMLFPEDAIGARLFPPDLATYLNQYYRGHGIDVLPGETAVGLEGEGTKLTLVSGSGRRLEVNAIVAGIGIVPNVDLALAAGLNVTDGIVVDSTLRTSHPDVYAAGDVANFYDQVLGMRRRVEHEDAANSMGAAAGRAMAGAAVDYDYLPLYYSDMFDLGYEAVGRLDARLETVADWQEPYRKGVIYYFNQQQVCGVLFWNVWGKVDEARQLLAEPSRFSAGTLQPER